MNRKRLFLIVGVVLLISGIVLVTREKDPKPTSDLSSVSETKIKNTSKNTHLFDLISDIFSRSKSKENNGVIDPSELPVPDNDIKESKVDEDMIKKTRSEKDYPLTRLNKSELKELYDYLEQRREDVQKQKELLESLNQELEKAKLTTDEKLIANLEDRTRSIKSYIKNMSSYIEEMEKKLAAAGLSPRMDK